MKKSFAENCIRYISTATALILALAMLCCANFSASAKNLGSNLTITDTTSLLEDINTTTNTTPAKTKDLIASGVSVELESTGENITVYFKNDLNWKNVYVYYWTNSSLSGIYHNSQALRGNNEGTDLSVLVNETTATSDGTYYKATVSADTTYVAFSSKSAMSGYYAFNGADIACCYNYSDSDSTFSLDDSKQKFSSDKTLFTITNTTAQSINSNNYYNGSWSPYSGGSGTSTYTVKFDANGGLVTTTSMTVTNGSQYGELPIPTYDGYAFDGWYTAQSGGTKIESTSTVDLTGNITLYAKWTENASSVVSEDILAILNGTKTQAYFGHPSSGWGQDIYIKSGSNGTNKTQIGTTKVSNVDCYYADFTLDSTTNLSNYNISDKSDWEGMSVGVNEVVVGGAFYYIFSSNKDENGKVDPTTAQTSLGATRFTVGTTDKLSVTTKATIATSSTGNALKYQYYIKNGTNYLRLGSSDIDASTSDTTTEFDISTLPKGTYELITMLYDGHIYYVSDTTETDTFTISDSYTVTFNANGHGDNTETPVEPGGTVSAPTAPTADGYTFGGWYKESTCVNKYDFNTAVTDNITLYAKWTANEYTVTFDYKDGATTSTTKVVTYNEAYGELPNPTRENYTFDGWYLEDSYTTNVTSTTTVTTADNHTLYAKWTAKEYNINYVLNEGTINGDYATKYTYGVGAPLPTDVTKDGYTFGGWYDNEGMTGDPVTSISTDETEDKTFYAKWEPKAFKHKYVFLDVSDKDWFYAGSCVGVVSFDGGTTYEKMNELFTDTSGYETAENRSNKSKLLFAVVPKNTTTITFARNNIENGEVKYHNPATYKYDNNNGDNFGENNLLKLDNGSGTLSGTWSTFGYTPVPINFTVGTNGNVYLNNNCRDSNNNAVDMPVTSGTIYADKAAISLKVKATPDAENRYELNTLKVNDVDKAGEISDKSVGGTVDVGTLGDTNTVVVTFKASQSPKVKVQAKLNSTIKLIYTDPDGAEKTGTEFDTEYEIKYNSAFTLEITPKAGYYVSSVSGVTATVPASGTITATKEQVKDNLTVSYELAENPTVTIECYDTSGTKLTIGTEVKITIGEEAVNSKKVKYDDSNGTVFVANVTPENSYQFVGFYTQAPTEENPLQEANKITTSESALTGCKASAADNALTVKNVTSDVTLYAIFSQQYKVTFKYTNLTNFTVDGKAVATEGSVYVSAGANLNLVATLSDDYKLTADCWSITPTDVGTFAPNGTNAFYTVGTSNVEITITPQIATYTGEGKWGSKTLKIDTSGVKNDTPWFAAKFKVVNGSDTTYEWVRFSEVKTDNYECVIPDNAVSVKFCRMATKATSFTEDIEGGIESKKAWNVTDSFISLGNTSSEYTLAFVNGEPSKITATKKTNN